MFEEIFGHVKMLMRASSDTDLTSFALHNIHDRFPQQQNITKFQILPKTLRKILNEIIKMVLKMS